MRQDYRLIFIWLLKNYVLRNNLIPYRPSYSFLYILKWLIFPRLCQSYLLFKIAFQLWSRRATEIHRSWYFLHTDDYKLSFLHLGKFHQFEPRRPVIVAARNYIPASDEASAMSIEKYAYGMTSEPKVDIFSFHIDVMQPYGVFSTSYNHYLTAVFILPV